jgi:hypothetical protein
MNKFLKVHIVSHIFAYQYIEITIASVLFKSMYHYKDIYSNMTFLTSYRVPLAMQSNTAVSLSFFPIKNRYF